MAYKFQTLAARMSGSLTQEGDVLVFDHSNNEKASIGIDGHVSGSGALSAGGNLRTAGTVRFDGVADAALDVSADSFYYLDGDSLVKRDTMADYATAIAGDGLAASAGVLSVSLTELTEAAVNVGADSLIFIDADGNVTRRDTFADYATAAAGDGLAAASGVLAVAVSGAIHVSGDKVSITGSFAGDCLDRGPNEGVDSIASLQVVADESTIEAAGRSSLRIKDDGVTGAKLAPAVAGAGLAQDGSGNLDVGAATNGGIAVNANDINIDISDLAAAAIASGDTFAFDDSGTTKKESVDDLATLFAGDGLTAASAVISVAVSGAVKIASDKVGISGSIAGDALDFAGGADSLSALHVVADESTIESAGRTSLRIKDDGVTGAKLAPAVAGYGLAQDGSGNLDLDLNELTAEAIASGDFLAFVDNTDNGTHKETVDDLATLFAGTGLAAASAVLSLDLNELGAATVDVANDSIAIIDANDSNASRKESIADLVSGIAGSGLAASNGVLSVQGNTVTAKADGDTLTEGYNVFADLSSNATVTLPSGSQGDVVVVKARNLTSGANIIVNPSGSQAIDGLSTNGDIRIESPFGAITLVYVQANDWRIV